MTFQKYHMHYYVSDTALYQHYESYIHDESLFSTDIIFSCSAPSAEWRAVVGHLLVKLSVNTAEDENTSTSQHIVIIQVRIVGRNVFSFSTVAVHFLYCRLAMISCNF